MGHRLTIAVASWRATVSWSGELASAVTLTADAGSLHVVAGEGGVTPLSAAEKHLATGNALKCLGAEKFPEIRFESESVEAAGDGYRIAGTVEIQGVHRHQTIDVAVADLDDSWRMSAEVVVRQTDFGVKPYSMLMGAMKVADEVTVSFQAARRKDG
jgi:polyisoprenoid-binding protein YceI